MPDRTYEELEPFLKNILAVGGCFWGKFTCQGCGSRQTFERKNLLFTQGICEECGYTSELKKWGFMALFGARCPEHSGGNR